MKNNALFQKILLIASWICNAYLAVFALIMFWGLVLFSAWLLAPSSTQREWCGDGIPMILGSDGAYTLQHCPIYTVPGPSVYDVSASLPAFLLASAMVAGISLVVYGVTNMVRQHRNSGQQQAVQQEEHSS